MSTPRMDGGSRPTTVSRPGMVGLSQGAIVGTMLAVAAVSGQVDVADVTDVGRGHGGGAADEKTRNQGCRLEDDE